MNLNILVPVSQTSGTFSCKPTSTFEQIRSTQMHVIDYHDTRIKIATKFIAVVLARRAMLTNGNESTALQRQRPQ